MKRPGMSQDIAIVVSARIELGEDRMPEGRFQWTVGQDLFVNGVER
jgi:hypothetical protein